MCTGDGVVQVEKSCNSFLQGVVIRYLHPSALPYGQDHPVSYLENKESLLQDLEKLNWPITYEDVKLLEDEILTGLTYIEQASELQAASKEEAQKICPFHLCPSKEKLAGKGVHVHEQQLQVHYCNIAVEKEQQRKIG
ncbi:UNVERIFIED_CONTAM: hypothetical protein K2H54_041767 [Gekko kuhli]